MLPYSIILLLGLFPFGLRFQHFEDTSSLCSETADSDTSGPCTFCVDKDKLSCSGGNDITGTLEGLRFYNSTSFRNYVKIIVIHDFGDDSHNFRHLAIFPNLNYLTFQSVNFTCSCSLLWLQQMLEEAELGQSGLAELSMDIDSKMCHWSNNSQSSILALRDWMFTECEKIEIPESENFTAVIGSSIQLKCNTPRGIPEPKVRIGYQDIITREWLRNSSSELNLENLTAYNAGCYRCYASNDAGWKSYNRFQLTIANAAPIIVRFTEEDNGQPAVSYLIIGSQPITLEWTLNGQLLADDFVSAAFPDPSDSCPQASKINQIALLTAAVHVGDRLRLKAFNEFGMDEKMRKVQSSIMPSGLMSTLAVPAVIQPTTQEKPDLQWKPQIIFPVIAAGLVVLMIVVFIVVCRVFKRHRFSKPSSLELKLAESVPLTVYAEMTENPDYARQSTNDNLKVIEYDSITFVKQLGEGAFGIVYQGTCKNLTDGDDITTVAIKTMKEAATQQAIRDFEVEAEVMSDVKHRNIVLFYGICYHGERLMMMFEYMENGDLNNYLRKNGPDSANLGYSDDMVKESLEVKDLVYIAQQVSEGLNYLSSRHFVHRDLATRNCLVGQQLTVKIGDFGMSRDVYATDYYKVGGEALLPIRWMPPESILYRRFTIESDVWSFGVVLWEIFTCGRQPWCELSNCEVMESIKDGKVLYRPANCPTDIYDIMRSCWKVNSQERITTDTINLRLNSLLLSLANRDDHLLYNNVGK